MYALHLLSKDKQRQLINQLKKYCNHDRRKNRKYKILYNKEVISQKPIFKWHYKLSRKPSDKYGNFTGYKKPKELLKQVKQILIRLDKKGHDVIQIGETITDDNML